HQIFQFLAGLEERDLLCRNFHAVAGFRVAAHARLALARAEAAQTAAFNFAPPPQRAHHAVKDRIHNHFAVFAGEFRQPGNFFDQVSLRHMPFAPLGRCRLAVPRAPAYNLLKFKGFYASREAGTWKEVLSSQFSVLRNGADSPYRELGTENWELAISTDSKSRPAALAASRGWANNRKHRQTADPSPSASLSAGRPVLARLKYSPPGPYPSPRLQSLRSDPPASGRPPAGRSRLFRSRWRGCRLLSHACRRLPPGWTAY